MPMSLGATVVGIGVIVFIRNKNWNGRNALSYVTKLPQAATTVCPADLSPRVQTQAQIENTVSALSPVRQAARVSPSAAAASHPPPQPSAPTSCGSNLLPSSYASRSTPPDPSTQLPRLAAVLHLAAAQCKMPRYDERDRYSGSTRLYVGRLSSRTRTRDLEDLFARYGRFWGLTNLGVHGGLVGGPWWIGGRVPLVESVAILAKFLADFGDCFDKIYSLF
ncbi:hypothetical protein ACQ4PT_070448 [Festuca glaucescens]